MKKRWLAVKIIMAISTITVFLLLELMKENRGTLSYPALAAPANLRVAVSTLTTPTVTAIDPSITPNDIDTPVVIRGSNFTATISGTVILTTPIAHVGAQELMDIVWVNSTTLSATVPWGLDTGVYSLTVTNPEGGFDALPNAFTITQGLDVWTTNGPYGGHISQVPTHTVRRQSMP